jgi:hypothetical protein
MRHPKNQQNQPEEPLQQQQPAARHRYLMEESLSLSFSREGEPFELNSRMIADDSHVNDLDTSPLLFRIVKPSSHKLYTVRESFSEESDEDK